MQIMALLRRVATISGLTLVSRILGLIRDRLLAGAFGASLALDAFLLAFALPNVLRNLFGEGALSAAFVPRYTQTRQRDAASALALAGAVLTRLVLGLGVVMTLAMIAAALVASQAEPGSKLATVAALALPQLPYAVFICASAIIAGMLNVHGRFAVPAFAPVLLNVMLIAAVLWDPQVETLALAVLLSGVLQLFWHVADLARERAIPPLLLRSSPELSDLQRALAPTLAASSVYQVNALLDSIIAYALIPAASGAVAILYFGNRLLQFPMALVAHGVGTAIYPELSAAASQGPAASAAVLRRALSLLLVLLVPAAAGLLCLADPLVRVVYQTGAFAEDDATRCVRVTMLYALALVPISLAKLQVRVLHAHRDSRTPLRIGLAGVGINLVLNIALVQTPLAEAGLALATVISALVNQWQYERALTRLGCTQRYAWPLLMRIVGGSVIMAAVVMLSRLGCAGLPVSWQLAVGVVAGALAYAGLLGPTLARLYRGKRDTDPVNP